MTLRIVGNAIGDAPEPHGIAYGVVRVIGETCGEEDDGGETSSSSDD